MPVPARSDGRPSNVTLRAKAGQDAGIAKLALTLEAADMCNLSATDWPLVASELSAAPDPESFKVAVCGADMSGFPLNYQMSDRGGKLVKEAATSGFSV